MNVLVGALIGWFAQAWLSGALFVVGWATVFALGQWFLNAPRRDKFLAHLHATDSPDRLYRRRGWSPARAYIQVEWLTAFTTSLLCAAVIGLLRALIGRG